MPPQCRVCRALLTLLLALSLHYAHSSPVRKPPARAQAAAAAAAAVLAVLLLLLLLSG